MAASAGQFLLTAGTRGKRCALPHAEDPAAPGLRRHRRHRRRHRAAGRRPALHARHGARPHRRAHRAADRADRARTRCATAGTPPSRPSTTASSTASPTASTSCPEGDRAVPDCGCRHEHATRSPTSSRSAATSSARSTSTAGCSSSASSTSAPRSTTASPTCSSRSSCTSPPSRARTPISLYLNSPGGSPSAALAVYDTMRHIRPDVATTCVGQAGGPAAVLLAGGARGRRAILPHSTRDAAPAVDAGTRHGARPDPARRRGGAGARRARGGARGRHRSRREALRRDTDRDLILPAAAAVEYGLADHVLTGAGAGPPARSGGEEGRSRRRAAAELQHGAAGRHAASAPRSSARSVRAGRLGPTGPRRECRAFGRAPLARASRAATRATTSTSSSPSASRRSRAPRTTAPCGPARSRRGTAARRRRSGDLGEDALLLEALAASTSPSTCRQSGFAGGTHQRRRSAAGTRRPCPCRETSRGIRSATGRSAQSRTARPSRRRPPSARLVGQAVGRRRRDRPAPRPPCTRATRCGRTPQRWHAPSVA